jgi:hypothetical protein
LRDSLIYVFFRLAYGTEAMWRMKTGTTALYSPLLP